MFAKSQNLSALALPALCPVPPPTPCPCPSLFLQFLDGRPGVPRLQLNKLRSEGEGPAEAAEADEGYPAGTPQALRLARPAVPLLALGSLTSAQPPRIPAANFSTLDRTPSGLPGVGAHREFSAVQGAWCEGLWSTARLAHACHNLPQFNTSCACLPPSLGAAGPAPADPLDDLDSMLGSARKPEASARERISAGISRLLAPLRSARHGPAGGDWAAQLSARGMGTPRSWAASSGARGHQGGAWAVDSNTCLPACCAALLCMCLSCGRPRIVLPPLPPPSLPRRLPSCRHAAHARRQQPAAQHGRGDARGPWPLCQVGAAAVGESVEWGGAGCVAAQV